VHRIGHGARTPSRPRALAPSRLCDCAPARPRAQEPSPSLTHTHARPHARAPARICPRSPARHYPRSPARLRALAHARRSNRSPARLRSVALSRPPACEPSRSRALAPSRPRAHNPAIAPVCQRTRAPSRHHDREHIPSPPLTPPRRRTIAHPHPSRHRTIAPMRLCVHAPARKRTCASRKCGNRPNTDDTINHVTTHRRGIVGDRMPRRQRDELTIDQDALCDLNCAICMELPLSNVIQVTTRAAHTTPHPTSNGPTPHTYHRPITRP